MKTSEVISIHTEVGSRIKDRRRQLDISQTKLAEMMGTSYQQIQKYESGANQLTLRKLLQFAKVMNVDPSFFYEGLPLEELEEELPQADTIARRPGVVFNILLVEDNPADALLFSKAITPFEGQVELHCQSDPELVMDSIHRFSARPDPLNLVVLDISLPKISGLQLLKTIKSNSQTATVPCIILTNSISRREMQEAYRLGAAGFIQKPIHLDSYREMIDTVLRYWLQVVALPSD